MLCAQLNSHVLGTLNMHRAIQHWDFNRHDHPFETLVDMVIERPGWFSKHIRATGTDAAELAKAAILKDPHRFKYVSSLYCHVAHDEDICRTIVGIPDGGQLLANFKESVIRAPGILNAALRNGLTTQEVVPCSKLRNILNRKQWCVLLSKSKRVGFSHYGQPPFDDDPETVIMSAAWCRARPKTTDGGQLLFQALAVKDVDFCERGKLQIADAMAEDLLKANPAVYQLFSADLIDTHEKLAIQLRTVNLFYTNRKTVTEKEMGDLGLLLVTDEIANHLSLRRAVNTTYRPIVVACRAHLATQKDTVIKYCALLGEAPVEIKHDLDVLVEIIQDIHHSDKVLELLKLSGLRDQDLTANAGRLLTASSWVWPFLPKEAQTAENLLIAVTNNEMTFELMGFVRTFIASKGKDAVVAFAVLSVTAGVQLREIHRWCSNSIHHDAILQTYPEMILQIRKPSASAIALAVTHGDVAIFEQLSEQQQSYKVVRAALKKVAPEYYRNLAGQPPE
jgi:hypothetical protein